MRDFLRGLAAMFEAPRLHAVIKEQENIIRMLRADLKVARGKPQFSDVARDFDAGPFFQAVKERVVEDMAPALRSHALDNLTRMLHTESAGKGLPAGRVAMLGEYRHNGEGYTAQVEVTIPEMRHTFTAYIPAAGADE